MFLQKNVSEKSFLRLKNIVKHSWKYLNISTVLDLFIRKYHIYTTRKLPKLF